MLLKTQDVTYHRLVRQFGIVSEIVSGVGYQGSLFVQGNSYPKTQRQTAITEMRRSFLDPDPAIACILVEDTDIVTIWYEDRYIIKIAETDGDVVQYYNLAQLVEAMRSAYGVKIEDRSQSFRFPHRRCFVGKEAVNWVVTNLKIDRACAIALCQRLIDEKWAKNLSNREGFQDGDLFYQFLLDK